MTWFNKKVEPKEPEKIWCGCTYVHEPFSDNITNSYHSIEIINKPEGMYKRIICRMNAKFIDIKFEDLTKKEETK